MFLVLQQEILLLLFRKGPFTEGVFRVSCNSKNLNALKDQLNSGAQVDMEALPVTLLVGVLKVNNTLRLQWAQPLPVYVFCQRPFFHSDVSVKQ